MGGKKRGTLEEFIFKAEEIHDNTYSYINSIYLNNHTDIEIICHTHGSFYQTSLRHINRKAGCPKCAGRGLTEQEIIYRFKEMHGEIYMYPNINYKGMNQKINIMCPIHGSFTQQAASHLHGCGCPKCSKSGFHYDKPAILYFFEDTNTGLFKLGITNRSIIERFPGKIDNIRIIKIINFPTGKEAKEVEQILLEEFAEFRIINNEYKDRYGGHTEFFDIDLWEGVYL